METQIPQKLEMVRDSTIGATVKPVYGALRATMDSLEAAAVEQFGKDGVAKILTAAGFDNHTQVLLPSIMPVAFALGFAAGAGRSKMSGSTSATTATTSNDSSWEKHARGAHDAINQIRATKGLAPLPYASVTTATPKEKSFPELVAAKERGGMTKAAAVTACVQEFPAAHREWLSSGDTQKL